MHRSQLEWIQGQRVPMIELLQTWADINSGTDNLAGLATMLLALKTAFAELGGDMQEIPLPPRIRIDSKGQRIEVGCGSALLITKHPKAPIKVLLAGHMDTVYPINSPFQKSTLLNKDTLRGPGVADMKGGLIVLFKALQAFEQSPLAGKIGWEVLINPDEEVGSPSSESLFIQAAKRNHIGLLFEPSYPDGSIVSSRKGSANFTVVVKGRSAHAGRDFHAGRNAISAMARFIIAAEDLMDEKRGITLNIGHVEGGGASNIVPDLAICRFNMRMIEPEDLFLLTEKLQQLALKCSSQEGISITLFQTAARAPKPFDKKNQDLFKAIQECGKVMGIDLQTKPSGGVCDGNILSAEGLPTIDTLGVIGGDIHTPDEYVLLNSLTDRASLCASFLMKLASHEIKIPNPEES